MTSSWAYIRVVVYFSIGDYIDVRIAVISKGLFSGRSRVVDDESFVTEDIISAFTFLKIFKNIAYYDLRRQLYQTSQDLCV